MSVQRTQVLRDFELREALAAYYDFAHELAGGDERCGRYHEQFVDELAATGMTQQSTPDLIGLAEHLLRFPSMEVALRRLVISVSCQSGNYELISANATTLRAMLP